MKRRYVRKASTCHMDNAVQVMRPGIVWNASCVDHWLFICSTYYIMHVLHRQCIQSRERERQLILADGSSLAARSSPATGLSLLHHYSYSQASPLQCTSGHGGLGMRLPWLLLTLMSLTACCAWCVRAPVPARKMGVEPKYCIHKIEMVIGTSMLLYLKNV